ncbi:hypothetical protein IPJ91_03385 [bacterium]|nr:MAG: hypothetical protein IPJ91_03385 [bacterium]
MTTIQNKILKLKEIWDLNLIPQEHKHEVHPNLDISDRLNYTYFTFPVALNFQRNSPALWKAALDTFEDTATNYLFYPEKVVETDIEKVRIDLRKHKLSLQPNKHTDIWIKLAKTFRDKFEDDPRIFFKKYDFDVVKIKQALEKDLKSSFPYLSGAKMANYWLYILYNYSDAKFANLDKISIIPDTHVMQCSIQLGIATESDSREVVAEKWFEVLKGTNLIPIDMHPILWNWSRNNFKPEIN